METLAVHHLDMTLAQLPLMETRGQEKLGLIIRRKGLQLKFLYKKQT